MRLLFVLLGKIGVKGVVLEMGSNLKSFEHDIYNRRVIAENLTKIIEAQYEPMVISLDSDWGTGKTTFIKMWKDLLDTNEEHKDKFKTLYFNAWESDYIKDPLLAIFADMEKQIHEDDSNLKKNYEKVKSKVKPIGKAVVATGIKVATAGVLNIDGITLGDYNEAELIKLAEKLGDLSIKEISADKTIRAKFKEDMVKYQGDIGKKIIFFIDELDRCRPTFAIELLEVIKHLFNMDNFIFIVAIDKEQLSHSVSTVYGENMDTLGYLRRFFDLDYKLPNLDIKKYIDNKNHTIFTDSKNIELLKLFLKDSFIRNKFSLRDIDKAYYYIELLLPLVDEFKKEANDNNTYIAIISYLYAILIAAKIKNPLLYKKVINCDYKTDEIITEFKQPDIIEQQGYIQDWHPKPLRQLINQILKVYLDVNLISNSGQNIYNLDGDKFMVGVKKEDGSLYYDSRFSMLALFTKRNLNINSKLEFLEGFTS